MERWDQLSGGGRFFYDDALFPPGTDTFLLSAFPRAKPGWKVCDLGAGTGLLGLLLLRREPALSVTGVELQEAALALAEKTAAENGLSSRLTFLHADLRQLEGLLPAGGFDLVVSNPPYFLEGSGFLPVGEGRQKARAELSCTLEEVCLAAARLTRWGGSFCLVHRPERLTDLLCALRGAGLEPKRLRPVCPRAGAVPSLLLAEGRRGGKAGLSMEPPLILQREDGSPTAEVDAVYFRSTEGGR